MSGTVDVTRALDEFEQTLAQDADRERCFDVLAVLWRWQRDPDLTDESQRRARALVQRYGRAYAAAGR
jgi:Tfp pilus assembly protein PilF